jgi:hypothetical protein
MSHQSAIGRGDHFQSMIIEMLCHLDSLRTSRISISISIKHCDIKNYSEYIPQQWGDGIGTKLECWK